MTVLDKFDHCFPQLLLKSSYVQELNRRLLMIELQENPATRRTPLMVVITQFLKKCMRTNTLLHHVNTLDTFHSLS